MFLLYRLWERFYRLRRAYFQSAEFQQSHASRSLLFTQLPDSMKTPDSLEDYLKNTREVHPLPNQISIGRDATVLMQLVEVCAWLSNT